MSGIKMVGAVAVLPRIQPHGDEIRFIKAKDQLRDVKKPRNPEFSKRYSSCENLDNHCAKGKERKQLSYKNTFFNIIENKLRPHRKNKRHKSTDNLQLMSPTFDQQYGRDNFKEEKKEGDKGAKKGKGKERMRGWRDLGRYEEVEYRQVDNKFYKEGDRKFLDVQDLRPENSNFRPRFNQELFLERDEVGGRKKKQHEDELEQQRKKIHQEFKFYNKTGLPLIGTKSELERAIENYKYSKLKEGSNKKTQLEELMEGRNIKNAQVAWRGRSSCSPSGSDVSTSSGENRYLY